VQIETPEEAAMFIEQLKPVALRLILDGNSNHVIQRCLQKFDACHTQVILDTVAQHSFDVACHRHGCCVLQRCMDYAIPRCKRDLVMRVSEHGLELSQNAFGNYVVQVRPAGLSCCACDLHLPCLWEPFLSSLRTERLHTAVCGCYVLLRVLAFRAVRS
jgi:hypothetical protein